ncbi:MAG: TetR/AcrR family transcriptional regulator [Phycisphaeraceae bacterium]|nr:TetR/AcrR family transcriptional regulator [Phycisphaeraceae bacterium]
MWANAEELKELQPRQQRSRETRRRILTAANTLLRTRPFGTLSVQEIATAAGCSIGAFYGRFRGKDDLLAPLLDRHNRSILRGLRWAKAAPGWQAMSLEERLEWITRMTVWTFRSRRWLIRALAMYVRQDSEHVTGIDHGWRAGFARCARSLLIDFGDQIAHADRDGAIDFALFLISTLCRERVLFGELSEREWVIEGDDALVSEVSRAACSYLKGSESLRGCWLGA